MNRDLKYLLSGSELEYLEAYEHEWNARFGHPAREDPNCFLNLGDNPDNRLSWSAAGKVPGMRKSAGRLWHGGQHLKSQGL